MKAYPKRGMAWTPRPCRIEIDDQMSDDMSYGFCTIDVSIPNGESTEFTLNMDYVPFSDDAEELIQELDGKYVSDEDELRYQISIPMTLRCAPKVRQLAKAIRKVVGRGKCYLNPNWKWMAPRAAASLEEFARVLADAYRQSRRKA